MPPWYVDNGHVVYVDVECDGKGSEKERDDGRDGESHFPSHMLLLNLSFRISHTVVFGEGIYMW
jgi:hypothetical protein